MNKYPRAYNVYPEPEGTVFVESWCSDLEKSAIEYSLNIVSGLEAHNVEIGCFEGRSTVFTANILNPEILHAIDPWIPVDYAPYEQKVYSERDIFALFSNNIEVGTNGNVVVHKMGWEQFFADKTPEDFPIKYIYVDGPHGYDDVLYSLQVLQPYIIPGGVMIGDDYDDVEVKRAVMDHFGADKVHPYSERTWQWING